MVAFPVVLVKPYLPSSLNASLLASCRPLRHYDRNKQFEQNKKHQEPTANQNTTHLPISRASFLECSRAPSNQSMLVQSSAFFRSTAGHNSDLKNRIRHRSCSEDKLEKLHRRWVALSLRMGSHKHPGLVFPKMQCIYIT